MDVERISFAVEVPASLLEQLREASVALGMSRSKKVQKNTLNISVRGSLLFIIGKGVIGKGVL